MGAKGRGPAASISDPHACNERGFASQEDTMSIVKPALCAAALVAAAAVAIPAIAQQSPQGGPPNAAQPAPGPDGRGGDWRGGPRDRYSDEDAPRWRRWEGRRYGREDREDDGPPRWHGPRFGERDGMMGGRDGMGGRGG